MNAKTWIPLTLAVMLGLVAIKVTATSLRRRIRPSHRRPPYPRRRAKHNVPAGTALRRRPVAREHRRRVSPESVFRDPAELEGRVVTSGLAKGQPVMETLLGALGTGSGLQAVVPKGMGAITLEVNEFSGLAGFLAPGCRVDVVSTISGRGRRRRLAHDRARRRGHCAGRRQQLTGGESRSRRRA